MIKSSSDLFTESESNQDAFSDNNQYNSDQDNSDQDNKMLEDKTYPSPSQEDFQSSIYVKRDFILHAYQERDKMTNYNIRGFTLNQLEVLKKHGRTVISPSGNYELLKHDSALNIVESCNGDYIIYGQSCENSTEYRIDNISDYEQIKHVIK